MLKQDKLSNQNKVAIVIGAGDATGSAIAKRFAIEGYTIVATRRQQAALLPLVEEIESHGGKVHAFGCDARDEKFMIYFVLSFFHAR